MSDMFRRYARGLTLLIGLLVAFWLVMLVIVPNITLFESSFRPYLPVTEVGGPRDTYSFANYLKVFDGLVETSFLGIPFHIPVHILTFFLTIWYSMVVTVICFVLPYPLAYYMAKTVQPKSLPTLFLLLFVPLWVSEVLRAFAWWIILALKGPLNALLLGIGILDRPVRWIVELGSARAPDVAGKSLDAPVKPGDARVRPTVRGARSFGSPAPARPRLTIASRRFAPAAAALGAPGKRAGCRA